MSTFLEQTRARVPRLAEAVQQRARLSVVATPANPAPRVPFAAFVLAVLGLGLVGLLMLNTSLQHQAFYARSLEQRAEALDVRTQALQLEVDALRAPERVAVEAQQLGMVPNRNPTFLFLADGRVRGRAAPADAGGGALALDAAPVADVAQTPRASRDTSRENRDDGRGNSGRTGRNSSDAAQGSPD